MVKGVARVELPKRGEPKVRISELPANCCIQDYKESLNKMIDRGVLKSYTEHHKNDEIDFLLTGFDLTGLDSEAATAKALGLVQHVSTRNMVLFDATGKIKKYADELQIFEEHFEQRLVLYNLRKQALLT